MEIDNGLIVDRFIVRLTFLSAVALILGTVYVCITFPILGHHGPACICDNCLDRMDQGRW